MTLGELIRQQSYEKILHCLRRHPVTFLKDLLIIVALFFVPIVFFIVADQTIASFLEIEITKLIVVLLGSVYYLSVWLIFYTQFVDYYLDNWVITNDRILNIEQHALFGRTMSEMDLYKVQDATSDIKGILPTLFNYGNVHIQTAGQKERFVFEQISDPHKIRDIILNLAEEDRKFHYHDFKKIET